MQPYNPNVVTSEIDEPELSEKIESVTIDFPRDAVLERIEYDPNDRNKINPKKIVVKTKKFTMRHSGKNFTFVRGEQSKVSYNVASHIFGRKNTNWILGLKEYDKAELADERQQLANSRSRWQYPLPIKIVDFKERVIIEEELPEDTIMVS